MPMIDMAIIYRGAMSRPSALQNIERLAESMKEIGLTNPICVKKTRRLHGGRESDCYQILAGNHRYEAAVRLGWLEIECKVVDTDALREELIEIDENIVRSPYTPSQEAHAYARRKEIYEILHPETRAGVAQAIGMHKSLGNNVVAESAATFNASTAKATGKSERAVREIVARGRALDELLPKISGTVLDRAGELDALIELTTKERLDLVERASSGEAVSAKQFLSDKKPTKKVPARISKHKKPGNDGYERLIGAWEQANANERKMFLQTIAPASEC